MNSMFGPNGQRVLTLITGIPGLTARQVDQVTIAWKQNCPRDCAEAWAKLNHATAEEEERYRMLAVAPLAEVMPALGGHTGGHTASAADSVAATPAGDAALLVPASG
jgi:hypothetical protein